MFSKKILYLIICISLFSVFILGSTNLNIILAQEEVEQSLPNIPGADQPTNFVSYVKYIYLLMLYLVGLTAFGVLVYAGFVYMLADTVVSKEEAKKWIFGAISGLILALAAFLILNTINPDLVNWQLDTTP